MTRYLVLVMFVSVQLTMDRQVQGEPSPDPKGEKIGRTKFLNHINYQIKVKHLVSFHMFVNFMSDEVKWI